MLLNTPFKSSIWSGTAVATAEHDDNVFVEMHKDDNIAHYIWPKSETSKRFATGVYFYSDCDFTRAWRMAPVVKKIPKIHCDTVLLHPQAKAPTSANEFALGYDLYCVGGLDGLENLDVFDKHVIEEWEHFGRRGFVDISAGASYIFRTGFKQAIQEGWGCMICGRSGLGVKKGFGILAGVIDSDYRGEWFIKLVNHDTVDHRIRVGDRIAQAVYQEQVHVHFPLVQSLTSTEREMGGMGSTGS